MSFDDNNDPENEIPDWLKDLQDNTGDLEDSLSEPIEEIKKESHSRKLFSAGNTADLFEPASDTEASEYLQGDYDEDEEDTKEWLKNIQDKQRLVLDSEQITEDEEPPSFLKRIQELKDEDIETSEGDSHDWLKSLEQEDEPQEDNKEDPEWLNKIRKGESSSTIGQFSASVEEPETKDTGKAGDWIKKFTGELDPSTLDVKPEFKFEEDLDWISEQIDSNENSEEITSDIQKTSTEEFTEEPDWLKGMEEKSGVSDEIVMPDLSISGTVINDKHLDDFQLEDLEIIPELDQEGIPDWLNISDTLPEDEHGTPDNQTTNGNKSPTDVLNWLEEIRHAEGNEQVNEEEPEKSGPLFGLKNVLPAEPENILFSNNLVPRVELFVSNTQKSHISLLKNIITEEKENPLVEKQALAFPQQVFRWLIAGLLYLAILVPVLTKQTTTPLPSLAHPEITTMADTINALPPYSPVLVAFEYQPGLSGEMEAASAAVLDHLLIRGAQLAFISTSPTGPGLIEHSLSNILSNHSYITNHKYPNFGYISGGTAALLNFANDPQKTVPIVHMIDEKGKLIDGWKTEPLNQIKEINDFAMILVITDDPTTASSWIEQVQPHLVDEKNPDNNVPLAMVVSAQAEPLVFPYYNIAPKQVSALVSGLYGGVTYESLSVRENIASRYWDGFGNGLSVTISVVLLGGLINLLQGWQKTRKKAR